MKQWLQCCSRWVVLLLALVLIGIGCNGTSQPPKASLTASRSIVERVRSGTPVPVLPNETPTEIQVNDQIVVKEPGQGWLEFPDLLQVEVLPGTEIQLGEVKFKEGESIFIRLKPKNWDINS